MWPFKKKKPVNPLYPNPQPCNFRLVSYRWKCKDGSNGYGHIYMQSNPGVDGDQLTKRDIDTIIGIIKRGIVSEYNSLGPDVTILSITYLSYMTESEFYA